jgi:hypothetical protein
MSDSEKMASAGMPQLHESAPGVLQWNFYEDAAWRLRLVVFVGLAGFGWFLIAVGTAGAIAEGSAPMYVFAILFCVFVGWTGVWGVVCFLFNNPRG